MQRLIERLEIANRAIGSLSAVLEEQPLDAIHRDAAIQRFEYSFEATWKAAQRYLHVIEGMQAGSPKQVIRACFESSVFDETQARAALAMADDRNLTVHTYNEALALEIAARLRNHMEVLRIWIATLRDRSVTGEGEIGNS